VRGIAVTARRFFAAATRDEVLIREIAELRAELRASQEVATEQAAYLQRLLERIPIECPAPKAAARGSPARSKKP
jgi:hypothetical protein